MECSPPEPVSLEMLPLTAGGVLGDLAPSQHPVVVLLYDPSACFTCSTQLSTWLEARQRTPGRIVLVFSRSPSPREQMHAALLGIQPDAILARSTGLLADDATEVVMAHGRVLTIHPVRSVEGSSLFAAARDGSIESVLSGIGGTPAGPVSRQ